MEEEFNRIAGEKFNLQYGDGEFLSGIFGISDITFASVPVTQQIAVVQKAGWQGDGISSGVIGLAYPALTAAFKAITPANNHTLVHAPYSPILTTMHNQGIISPVFSVAINRDPSLSSFIALGGVVPSISAFGPWGITPIEYLQVSYLEATPKAPQHQFYAITPDAYLYQNITFCQVETDHWLPLGDSEHPTSQNQTILDTGTTLIYLPPFMAHFLASLYDPPATWNVFEEVFLLPCQAFAPAFAVKIGGIVFPVEKEDLILDEERGDGLCKAGFTAGELVSGIGILGDVFLRNVLVVFDIGAGEIRLRASGYY